MNHSTRLIAAMLLPMTFLAHAQEDQPTPVARSFDPVAAKAVLAQPDVASSVQAISLRERFRLRELRGLGFQDGAVCVKPTGTSESVIDMHRSLFIHDPATLGAEDFSLKRTLQKLSTDVSGSVPATTPASIFRQLWDTQAAAPGVDAANPHCSDDDGKIGAYPFNRCPRAEAAEAQGTPAELDTRIDTYKPVALVNRLDLAAAGWKNCGEYRLVYGKANGFRKNFIIFEAVLPNPKPGCRSGCRDVVEFWAGLSAESSPASRASKLEQFYYEGIPGFRPVVHTSHFSSGVSSVYGGSGSGQIRTNQFIDGDFWTLREFKTLLSCAGGECDYDLMPINVKVNPYGPLWNKDVAAGAAPPSPPANAFATPIANLSALAADFQSEVLAQVTPDRLGNPDPNTFTYEVELDKNAAESQSSGSDIDHYLLQADSATDASFKDALNAAGSGLAQPLSAEQLVNRALAHSCAGCHQPDNFGLTGPNALGPNMRWPAALLFVHIDTGSRAFQPAEGFDPVHFGNSSTAFNISPALLTTFLPARRVNLVSQFNNDVCDCVRKTTGLSPALLDKISQVQKKTDAGLRRALTRLPTQGDRPDAVLDAQRATMLRAEAERTAELQRLGVDFTAPGLRPEALQLGNERLTPQAFQLAKERAFERMVEAEPPRKTVTGSFRAH